MSHSTSAGTVSAGDHDNGATHAHTGSLQGYLTGFVLAAVLTIIPFWLVMGRVLDDRLVTIIVVLALAVVQIGVHIVFFLHLDTRSEGGWNMLAFIFAAVLVIIVLGASIWVLYNENANMMPGPPQRSMQQSTMQHRSMEQPSMQHHFMNQSSMQHRPMQGS